jgi:hypothetical protein
VAKIAGERGERIATNRNRIILPIKRKVTGTVEVTVPVITSLA